MLITTKLKLINENDNLLIINKQVAEDFNLLKVKSIIIRFGFNISEANILIDSNSKDKDIGISTGIIKNLKIPYFCNYNITVNSQKELVIGPFIGIYMAKTENALIKKLRGLNSFVKRYSNLNGAVFGFSLDNIDKTNLKMTGFIYNPRLDIWHKEKLPYPSAIFNRSVMDSEWRKYFVSLYGKKIYNYRPFDKWEMYEILSKLQEMEEHLPNTTLYLDSTDIINCLEEYNNIYIKPIDGKQGKGIYNLAKKEKSLILKTRSDGKNISKNFNNIEEILSFLEERLKIKKYIIQPTLDIQIDSKSIDFRVGMDKNQLGEWQKTTFLSRVSGTESIVSNRAVGGGTIKEIEDVLKDIYGMDDLEVKKYKEKLVSVATKAANYLEFTGLHLGKLAFDLAIDRNKKIWIIEINSRYPDDSLSNSLGKRHVYYDTRLTNMLYAKKLSGFDLKSNEPVFRFDEVDHDFTLGVVKKVQIYIGIFKKRRQEFKDYLLDLLNKTELSSDLLFDNDKLKFVLTLEGSTDEIIDLVNTIQKGNDFNKVIAIEKVD